MEINEFDFEDRIMSTEYSSSDAETEVGLRPQALDEYIGQEKAKEILKVYKTEEYFQSCPPITPAVLEKTVREVSDMSGYTISEAEARKYLVYDIDLKTEIHPLATLNDEFIGCIHKQLPDRHMIFSKDFTSLGCIPQERFEGVLKITLLVFNVAKDNTRYTLSVSGQ